MKYCIKNAHSEYWTGRSWSIVKQFAIRYSFDDAIAIIETRFHRMSCKPKLVSPKEKKKKKKKGKKSNYQRRF